MKKEFFFLVFFRMIVRYDYHAIRHFITLYAKDDDLLNLPYIQQRFGDFPTFTGKRFGDFRFSLYFCTKV